MPVRRNIKVVPPVIMDESINLKPDIGPIVLMSGFLTKRTRTLNRWKQRWWQLLDNGLLIYFKNDERIKLLGEIDIARTCYDVRLGADKCHVSFPRVAPSCCCISFAVLKRTYYLYAPTANEASRWAESITKASRVLNRRVVAGVDRRPAPAPPGPPRPPSCPPNFRINRLHLHTQASSISDSLEDLENERLYDKRVGFAHTRKMACSVPDYLDQVGAKSPTPPVFSPTAENGKQGSHSPQPHPRGILKQDSFPSTYGSNSMAYDSGSDTRSATVISPLSSYSNLSSRSIFASYNHKLDSVPETGILGEEDGEELTRGTLPRMNKRRKRASLPASFLRDFEMLENKEAEIRQRLKEFDLPPRPASMMSFSSSHHYSYQPPLQTRPRGTIFSSTEQHVTSPPPKQVKIQQNGVRNSANHSANKPQVSPRDRRGSRVAQVAPETATKNKPVPKPRKAGGKGNQVSSSASKQKKEPAFVTATRILRVYPSPPSTSSDIEGSVSVTTAQIHTINVKNEPSVTDSPPPRPRKDSGPPSFVPVPPRKDSGPPNFVPTPPPVEVLQESPNILSPTS